MNEWAKGRIRFVRTVGTRSTRVDKLSGSGLRSTGFAVFVVIGARFPCTSKKTEKSYGVGEQKESTKKTKREHCFIPHADSSCDPAPIRIDVDPRDQALGSENVGPGTQVSDYANKSDLACCLRMDNENRVSELTGCPDAVGCSNVLKGP